MPTEPTRRTPRWLLLAAGVLLVLRIVLGLYEHFGVPPLELVRWVPMERAEAVARAEGKPLLYYFTAAWCRPCKQMKRQVFANEEHARELNETFVCVKVVDRKIEDGENTEDVRFFQDRYGVASFPTLVVASATHGHPERIEGYKGAERLMERLRAEVDRLKKFE